MARPGLFISSSAGGQSCVHSLALVSSVAVHLVHESVWTCLISGQMRRCLDAGVHHHLRGGKRIWRKAPCLLKRVTKTYLISVSSYCSVQQLTSEEVGKCRSVVGPGREWDHKCAG
jgi:hypothetical protein